MAESGSITVRELLIRLGFKADTAAVDRWQQKAKDGAKRAADAFDHAAKRVLQFTAVAGAALVGFAIKTTAEFETLKASLATVTGSAANADAAFAQIKKFASETPFSVKEVTSAFIKLKALGLDPSEAALRSYGNTSSAMGKSLSEFIEAVADASTGEFERLKEFGIKASQQGDKVAFTFQGVTTTVGKNSEEIQAYLRKIGDVNFGGAMDKQALTFNGILSNLGDTIDSFLVQVGEGMLPALKRVGKEFAGLVDGGGSLGQTLGITLGRAIDSLWDAFKRLEPTLRKVGEQIPKLVGMLPGFIDVMSSLLQVFISLSSVLVGPTGATVGLIGLRAALSGALGPAGALATALATVTAMLIDVAVKAQDARFALDDQRQGGRGKRGEGAKRRVQPGDTELHAAAAKIERRIIEIQEAPMPKLSTEEQKLARFGSAAVAQNAELARRQKEIDKLTGSRARLTRQIKQNEEARAKRQQDEEDRLAPLIADADADRRQTASAATRLAAEGESRKAAAAARRRAGGGKKPQPEQIEGGLSIEDMLERDFGGGLGESVLTEDGRKVRPTLGTTINKITQTYSPQVSITQDIKQKAGESMGDLAMRITQGVRTELDKMHRQGADFLKGAVVG